MRFVICKYINKLSRYDGYIIYTLCGILKNDVYRVVFQGEVCKRFKTYVPKIKDHWVKNVMLKWKQARIKLKDN